ncbi:MAG: outer membrane lipoprotein-sorting protein [Thermodesulfobacteriota bacterium]|nr:outer membrane lipoprotein-sorting protein [Thermodesulfobacteriota bacterium]
MRKKLIIIFWMSVAVFTIPCGPLHAMEVETLVRDAVNYYRGNASFSVVDMTIHRPGWERSLTIKAWTRGEKDSLFTIVAPPKDNGNGTLKRGKEMWIFNPRVNRVIKLPPSMMAQSWMGSDFSNNDLAKSDSIIDDYTHKITGTETHDGKKVFIITSMPKPDAPVVWGMQKLRVREDFIFLSQEFYDEDLQLVKAMTGTEIELISGKLFPTVWKMQQVDKKDEYTLLEYKELVFKESLPGDLFNLSSLKNPGR